MWPRAFDVVVENRGQELRLQVRRSSDGQGGASDSASQSTSQGEPAKVRRDPCQMFLRSQTSRSPEPYCVFGVRPLSVAQAVEIRAGTLAAAPPDVLPRDGEARWCVTPGLTGVEGSRRASCTEALLRFSIYCVEKRF